jgi:ABC-type maltose transport system permease subunit
MAVNKSGFASLSDTQKIFGVLGIIGGIWLILAPFILNYGGATVFNATSKTNVPVDLSAVTVSDIICGVLLLALVGFSVLTAGNPATERLRFYANVAVVIVGVYLLAAPYTFNLLDVANYLALDKPNTNDQLIGIITILLGGFALQNTFLLKRGDGALTSGVTPSN